MGELIFLGILSVVSCIMFGMTFSFKTSILDQSGGPALFPRIIIICFLISLLIRAVKIIKDKELFKSKFIFIDMFTGLRGVFFGIFVLYALVLKELGFLVSTIFFTLITVTILYKEQYKQKMSLKRIIVTYTILILGVTFTYYLFTEHFNVLLPSGIIDF